MTRILVVSVALVAAVLLSLPHEAAGCGVAPRFGDRVDITEESALIVWDAPNKTEHFIRRASFQSTGYEFGFLVPTPTRPQLAEVDDSLFSTLSTMTEPRVEIVTKTAMPTCGGMAAKSQPGDATPAGVVMLEQGKVGDLDYSVLGFNPAAKDADPAIGAVELARWLQDHHYTFAPTLVEWLKPYIRDGWIITAFKVAGQKPAAEEPVAATGRAATGRALPGGASTRANGLKSTTVRMSFKTERPFYPYREPADQRDAAAQQVPRKLRVYVLAEKRMSGKLGDGTLAWPGTTVWANTLSSQQAEQVAGGARLPDGKLPAGELWLTEFDDRSSPRPGTDDVYFEPAATQSPVARPPIIRYEFDDTPWMIGFAVCAGVPMLIGMALMVLLVRWLAFGRK